MFVRQLCLYTIRNYGARISRPHKPTVMSLRHQMTDSAVERTVNFDIKKDESDWISGTLKQQINVALDDFQMSINDKTMTFNLTWLRDSCHCDQCTHQHSRQRLYTAKDFRQDHFRVGAVNWIPANDDSISRDRIIQGNTENGLVRIQWADGHDSLYSLDWLEQVQQFCSRRKLNNGVKRAEIQFDFPRDDFYLPKLDDAISQVQWNVKDISRELRPVDYGDLLEGFKFNHETTFINANQLADMSTKRLDAITTVITDLVKYGLAKLVNVPCERDHVLKVARSLAYERPTGYGVVFDVVVEPSEQINLAYSSREFDLHTDLPYREMSPGVQLLHCISNTCHGGLSYFSDAFRAAKLLEEKHPKLYETLVQTPVPFVVRDPYRDMVFRRHQPMISLDHRDELKAVHYSPFTLPPMGHPDDAKLFYLAQDVFTGYLQAKDSKLITRMEPGDLYIFHNRRVLHGRSGYGATKSRRFLQGCYMDWDEITAFDEKLRSLVHK